MSRSELLGYRDTLLRIRAELRVFWAQRRDTPAGTEAREVLDALREPVAKLNAWIEKETSR